MKFIDEFLNQFTMYRITLYFLIGILFYAFVLSTLSFLPYSPLDLLGSICITVSVSYIANIIFAKIFKAVTNVESVFITALILSLIISPKLPLNASFLVIASIFAMAAKYFPTIEKRHVFNPAAASVAAISLLSSEHSATWWIGTPTMFIPVAIGGLLLVRKIRRVDMITYFFSAYFFLISIFSIIHTGFLMDLFRAWQTSFLKTSVVFFACVMLTEPLTSPTIKKTQRLYAILVAILYATPQIRFLGIELTPELSLIIGNVFAYVISPNYRLALSVLSNKALTQDTSLIIFSPIDSLKYKAGQYMEWTLPHKHTDSRGNRRYFSLASSPTETTPMLLVKFYEPSSSYKKSLKNLSEGKEIIATSLAGDFTLPSKPDKKIAFIAGGVGIAPFRSMVKYLLDTNQKRDITLLYSNKHMEDILFDDLWRKAYQVGIKTYYILTDGQSVPSGWTGGVGHLDESSISQYVPDYGVRAFYVSGPQLMVQNFENTLKKIGVKRKNIITDFFPGYSEKTG